MALSLNCQVCCTDFSRIFTFREHLLSPGHQQKTFDTFQEGTLLKSGVIPFIVFMDLKCKSKVNKPVAGLSLLTMCFSSSWKSFYLCHVCEQKCQTEEILSHIFSKEHYSNYFNYTNPNELSFSWFAKMDMKAVLWPKLIKQMDKKELLSLQMLQLPLKLLNILYSKTYSEVMQILSEKGGTIELFKAIQPKRMTIHAYQNSTSRKHPLLGMQHLVECLCNGPGEKRYYLCTLCNLNIGSHTIIKHVLSFDHLYCYFKAWHPSTLLSKESYKDYNALVTMMRDFAKQAEEIHGTGNASMKEVSLNPDDFKTLNFTCYTEALKKLESITKSSLTTNITPGNKIEFRAAISHPMSLKRRRCKICCQNCREVFDHIVEYEKHLSHWRHDQMMTKYFGQAGLPYGCNRRVKFFLGLFGYVKQSLRKNQRAVGTAMVVTCITTCAKAEPIYLCFACLDAFPQSCVKQHFDSRKHLINSLLYQNPWKLPFAWEEDLNDDVLRSLNLEEEMERKQDQIVLKIFDIPQSIFWHLDGPNYRQVMDALEEHHALLKREVPPCETFSKLRENEKFPLLGKQFMVSHSVLVTREQWHREVASLCLLCERKLSDDETEAHLFSREHVTTFLNHFHPGSLNSVAVDAKTLLDLAKQAACIHTSSTMQEVKLKKPMWEPYSYKKAIHILEIAKKREGKGNLKPPITPMEKLVPRNKSRTGKVAQNDKKDCEKNQCNAEKQETESKDGSGGDTKPTPSEKQLEEKKEVSPKNQTNVGAQIGAEGHSSVKCVPIPLNNAQGGKKRPRSLTEGLQEENCPGEAAGGEKSLKRQRLCSKDETSSEESTEIPNNGVTEEITAEGETSRKEAVVTAVHTLREHDLGLDSVPPSTLSPSCINIVNDSDALHATHDDSVKVVDLKTNDLENCAAAAADASAITETSSKTIQVSPESNEAQTTTLGEVAKSADNCQNVPRRCEDASSINVSKSNGAKLPPDFINIGFNANISHCTTTESLTMDGSPRRKEMAASICTAGKSNCTTSSKLAEVTSASSVTKVISVAKPVAVTRPQERKIRTSPKVQPASCNGSPSSQVKPTALQEGSNRTASFSKNNDPLRCPETASKDLATPRTENADETSTKMPKASAKPSKNDAPMTLNGKNSVETKTDVTKRNPNASPHQTSERPEHINANRETSHVSTSKATPSAMSAKVGSKYLVVVSWEKKVQIYCLLCSVKLHLSSQVHITSFSHHYNYVKRKYPQWSARPLELEDQLQQTVALLVKIEKSIPNSQNIQKVEVDKEMYQKLGGLPQAEAIAIVRKMVTMAGSLSSVHDDAQASLMLVSSPCEVSSSDDGVPVLHRDPGFPANNKSEQKVKKKHQIQQTQIAGANCKRNIESSSNEEANLTAGQLIEGQLTEIEGTPLTDRRFQSCTSFSHQPPDSFQPCTEIRHVKVVSESHEHLVNPDSQQERSDPASHWPQKYLESKQKSPRGEINSPNLQAATARPGQQDQSGSWKVEKASKYSAGPENPTLLQILTRTPIGKPAKGCSNLSFYLKASQQDTKAVIGIGSVWECRGNSLKTFYLCECCEKILSRHYICEHMVSFDHQLKYVEKEQPDLLQTFWFEEDVPHFIKIDIFSNIVVVELSKRERYFKVDAQCVLLESELHKVIRTAPFNKALKIVQSIRDEEKPSFFHKNISEVLQESQQPEDQQRVERSLFIEGLSEQTHQTKRRRDSVAGQKRDGTSTTGDLEARGVSSRPDVNCSLVKTDRVSPGPWSRPDVNCFPIKTDPVSPGPWKTDPVSPGPWKMDPVSPGPWSRPDVNFSLVKTDPVSPGPWSRPDVNCFPMKTDPVSPGPWSRPDVNCFPMKTDPVSPGPWSHPDVNCFPMKTEPVSVGQCSRSDVICSSIKTEPVSPGPWHHPHAISSPVKAEPVSQILTVGTFHTPQGTGSGLYLQPEFKPAVSNHPKFNPLLHAKPGEVSFRSSCPAAVRFTGNQAPEMNELARNESPVSRKRPADPSEDPLPAKSSSNPVQVETEPSFPSMSECPAVDPARRSTSMSAGRSKVLSKLATLLQKSEFPANRSLSNSAPYRTVLVRFSEVGLRGQQPKKGSPDIPLPGHISQHIQGDPYNLAPVNAHTFSHYATSSSEPGEVRYMLKTNMTVNQTAFDSKYQLADTRAKKNPFSNSEEGIDREASAHFGCKNQFIDTSVSSASSARNPAFDNFRISNFPVRPTENIAASAVVPSATTAFPSDQHYLQAVIAGNISSKQVSVFPPSSAAPNPYPAQFLQQQGPKYNFIPFNSTATAQTCPTNHMFLGCYNGQEHADVRGSQTVTDYTTSNNNVIYVQGSSQVHLRQELNSSEMYSLQFADPINQP